ncbi:MAG: hypothetical protein IPF64_16225 [Flavobacteriales bacterium]|nr:hypothetical protein [Flavobacteriales bacterium]
MAKKKRTRTIDIEIDKLTNSIEEVATGKTVATHVGLVLPEDKLIRAKDWRFDWMRSLNNRTTRSTRVDRRAASWHPARVDQLEDKGDHIHMHLLESAKFNQGKGKLFIGVPPNLVAHACRISFLRGYGGVVAFVAKTKLRQHHRHAWR